VDTICRICCSIDRLFSAIVIVLRLLWMCTVATSLISPQPLLHQGLPRPPARQIFIIGWTGSAGVVLWPPRGLPENLPTALLSHSAI